MPPPLVVDLCEVDLARVAFDLEAIQRKIPQRFEMAHLDRIHLLDTERGLCVGSKDVRPDEFWARGHIPGRPIYPGVLLLEALGQVCSFYLKTALPDDGQFFGFAGIKGAKFRGTVVPGDRLVLLSKVRNIRPRRAVFDCQGVVGDRLVVEAVITGLPV